MLNSALNFAVGFFGLPIEGQYQQSITIEAPGVSVFFYFLLLIHPSASSIILYHPIKRQ